MPQDLPDLSPDLSLGLVQLSKDALEQDWKVTDGYVSYSSELLRLALLAITGIAAICLKLLDKGKPLYVSVRTFSVPLALLLMSSGCALAHRYVSTDSMYFHIEGLRRTLRNRPARATSATLVGLPSDKDKADLLFQARKRRYKLASYLLGAVAALLLSGVALVYVISLSRELGTQLQVGFPLIHTILMNGEEAVATPLTNGDTRLRSRVNLLAPGAR